ncbi:MAG: Holliday junction resolvase RuvX [Eggerthellaceae bacterium]
MRILALDIGEVRIGIAVSDPSERIASPVCVLSCEEVVSGAPSFKRVLEDWEPDLLVCGLPYTLSGEEGPQAKRIRKLAEEISEKYGIELCFADERLSSKEAKRSLREKGFGEKKMRGKIDMVAASLFLQAWLDKRAADNERSE